MKKSRNEIILRFFLNFALLDCSPMFVRRTNLRQFKLQIRNASLNKICSMLLDRRLIIFHCNVADVSFYVIMPRP